MSQSAAQRDEGFVHISGAFRSTATDVKNAWTPNLDIFLDASKSLWLRLEGQGTASEVERIVNKAADEIALGLAECESPLEKRMLPYLVCQDYMDLNSGYAMVHVPKKATTAPGYGVFIVPQMAFMKYRADFGLVAVKNGRRHIVLIECDGRDYHDPVKDSARDAYFRSWGIPTVRVTGKEVYREVRKFAQLAADTLIALVEERSAA